jgi:DNA-binding response OmpR family regulator
VKVLSLHLRLDRVHRDSAGTIEGVSHMRLSSPPRSRPQILLVEDDPMLLEVLTEALKREHYSYVTARSGDEAIQAAYSLHPEVVLLDIDLPGQSGLLVAAKLKVARPSPKVLFLTALPRGQSDRVATFLRVEGVLHKPFPVKRLLGALNRMLGMAQAA